MQLKMLKQTTHEDRVKIDKEIERRTGVYCDYALDRNMLSKRQFKEIVEAVIRKRKGEPKKAPKKKRKKKKREVIVIEAN